ncbi:MAG: tRNA pseudouridine(55) synthase TruB [bacterium]
MPETNRIIPVYKPVGPATFDIIRIFKKKTDYKGKIGHGGSLDPFACGIVLLLIGKATKQFDEILSWKKIYLAGVRLDAISTTNDVAGEIKTSVSKKNSRIDHRLVEDTIKNFVGEIEQKVPPYSAAKFQGTPMYKFARKGIEIAKTKKVKIYNIEFIYLKYPLLTLKITCAGGVFIRQLVQDIALKMGENGFLYFLERKQVGEFTVQDCVRIEDFDKITIQ